MIWFQSIVSGWFSSCAVLAWTHRDVAVNDQQLLSCYVKLATEFVGFPVYYSESFVVRVKNGLQKLQFGLQPRNRHLLLISNHQAAGRGEVGAECDRAVELGLGISHISVRTTTKGWRVRSLVNTVSGIWQYWRCTTEITFKYFNHLVFYCVCFLCVTLHNFIWKSVLDLRGLLRPPEVPWLFSSLFFVTNEPHYITVWSNLQF